MNSDWLTDKNNALRFVELMTMVRNEEISSRATKNILETMCTDTRLPSAIAMDEGLLQVHDAGLMTDMAKRIIDANAKVVEEYKSGKGAALQFLIGQGMKESKGATNPKILKEVFENLLK
jgi:aspartyl-tRNA(Asn)/glutamyl-tRNA(Gln) amidotransferase subunit B